MKMDSEGSINYIVVFYLSTTDRSKAVILMVFYLCARTRSLFSCFMIK